MTRLRHGLELAMLFGLGMLPWCVPWTVAGAHIAAGLAAAAAIGLGLATRRWPLARTPADRAMLAWAAACGLATATSIAPAESAFALRKLLLLPIVQLAAWALPPPRQRRALRLFVIALAVSSAVAIARFALLPHAADARLRAHGHYMTFAGLVLLAWPPAVAAAVASRGRQRIAYAAAALVLAVALLLGFTRGAWLGAAVAGGAMLLRARPRRAWIVPVGCAVALAVVPPAFRARALSSFDPQHPNNVDRVRLWRAGVAIWRDHPWTGVGLVDLKPVYAVYRRSTVGQVHGHLHHNWIHVLATTGALGLAAFAWLHVGLGRIAWTAAGAARDAETRALGLGVWGALCGWATMGLFEWNFGDVEVTIALWFLLGAAAAGAPRAAPRNLPGGRVSNLCTTAPEGSG